MLGIKSERQSTTSAGLSVGILLGSLALGSTTFGQPPVPIPFPFVRPAFPPDTYFGYQQFGPPHDLGIAFPALQAPRSVRIHSELVASPPLPPARLMLLHRREEPLHVEVYDRKQRRSVFRGEIPAGASVELSLTRDAGGQVRETYQSVGVYGEPVQRQVIRALPIDPRYEVVVHRWQVQSIAIDRTGKSPSAVEDVQFQGQPLGRFTLPVGSHLIDGELDVYLNAVRAGNPTTIAPLLPAEQDDSLRRDPLQQAIQELNRR